MNIYNIICSNKRFNKVYLTVAQYDVLDFIAFESETSFVYPFAIEFDDITMEMVDGIIELCRGHTEDTDILYEACKKILGTIV